MKPTQPFGRTEEKAGTTENPTDEALMGRFCEGDSTALEELFRRHATGVRAFLKRMVGNSSAADDLTQTTFLSVVRGRGRFQRGARFRPWLFAIAANAARDHRRRNRFESLDDAPALAADGPSPRDPGLQRAVQQALAQLPGPQREAIVLHRFEGLSFAEIAQALQESQSTIKVRAHRGYQKLKELLREVWKEETP